MTRLLVTAALPYSNGRLHVGHIAGAYLPADIYVRYQRLTGREVRFVCGSDDHGVAIMISAEKEGKTPAEVAKYYWGKQKEDFAKLGISFDIYGSTSGSPYHHEMSQEFFLNVHKKGIFEKQSTKQFYDEKNKMFLPDRYIKGTCGFCGATDQNGDQCEECGKVLNIDTLKDPKSAISGEPATLRDTVHWFLDLSRFEKDVAKWLENAKVRDHTRSFVSGLLSSGLVKRSMTRDITWGIPVPLDDPDAKGKVLYVWFDAPIGYISNTLEVCAAREGSTDRYVDWWKSKDCEILHFIGEDNTIFHCVIWIAMLIAEGSYELPAGVIVNQFLNIQFPSQGEAGKISKSRGTAVWINEYVDGGGNVDSLRYYLTAIAPEKARTVYRPEDLIQRNNTDLANTLGNFVNRVVAFTGKYFGPQIPAFPEGKLTEIDHKFLSSIKDTHAQVTRELDNYQFKQALEIIMEFARSCNRYIDEKQPWTTRKTDMELTAASLGCALKAIHFLGIVLMPYLPGATQKIHRMLGLKTEELGWGDALKPGAAGSPLKDPEILFEKIETEK